MKLTSKLTLIILILFSPFAYYIAKNEYRAYNISNEINLLIENSFENYSMIADNSTVSIYSNDEACSLVVTKVLEVFARKEDWDAMKNSFIISYKNSSTVKREPYIIQQNPYLVIIAKDGPYSAGFDFRCW